MKWIKVLMALTVWLVGILENRLITYLEKNENCTVKCPIVDDAKHLIDSINKIKNKE